MDQELKTMLTETVTHQAYLGQDGYGKPQYSSGVTVPARVAYRTTTLVNAQGQERTSTTVIYLDGDITLTLRDKITLADGSAPAIQNIYSPTDPTRPGIPDHHEISL